MITLNSIKWKNFLSYGNIPTELNFHSFNQLVITGENGNGKSAICEVISYGLFGVPFRKVRLKQLINSINNKDLLVEVNFTINGDSYLIKRGMKPNLLEVYKNNNILNQPSNVKDFQKYIESEILGCNHKTFCQIAFLSTTNFTSFMNIPIAQRREIIENLLDIQAFSKMNDIVKEKLKVLDSEITKLDVEIAKDKHKLETAKELERKIANQQIKKDNSAIIQEKQKEIDILQTECQNLQTVMNNIVLNEKKLVPSLGSIPVYESKLNVSLDIAKKDATFFNQHSICPSCKQEISNQYKTSISLQIQERIDKLKTGLLKLNEEKSIIQEKIQEVKKYNADIDKAEAHYNTQYQELRYKQKRISDIERDVIRLKQENGRQIQLVNPISKEEFDSISFRLQTNIEKQKSHYYQKSILKKTLVILKDNGAKAKIVEYFLPVMNNCILKYLDILNLPVQFTFDEQFNEQILSRYKDDFSYSSFSEGEKARIDIAILFLFKEITSIKNSIETNVIIFDELFNSALDNEGIDSLKTLLNTLLDKQKVIVITHKQEFVDKFETNYLVKKVNDFSHIQI